MPVADELYPPAQYTWGWILLAIAILAAIVLVAWLVIALTRPKKLPPAPDAEAPERLTTADVATQLRIEYTDHIGQIESHVRSGEWDARRANLELSRAVRGFVNEYSGLEAPVMSLADFQALGVQPALLDALRNNYYPSVFRRGTPVDPLEGIEAARRVVAQWR